MKYIKRHCLLVLFLLISAFCYLSVLIPPRIFWPGVFTSYAIPGILIANLVLLLFLFFFDRKNLIYPLLAIIFGFPLLIVTFSVNQQSTNVQQGDISVLSFNAKQFRKRKTYEEFSFAMIKWAASDTSDIKCFQEYSTNSRWPVLDVTKQISEPGYKRFTFSAEVDDSEHNPGLAIFSKYPMVDSGVVWKKYGSINAGIFADVNINGDILRIYNIHLGSMGLQLYQYKHPSNYFSKVKRLVSRLKYGAEARSSQIDMLISHVADCPYPFIICGDFNETPYSYNYFKLRKLYKNAFEEAGNGFGFTFNSVLFFLRIDHQFIDEQFIPMSFHVDRSMKISDHFPTRAYYRLNK